jgi:isoleucyl-tRNA synthetase
MVDDTRQGGEELHHAGTHKPKGPFASREEQVLDFWNKEGIFEKTLEKPSPKGEYVFYDGPPFANGLPHYGHILASTIKDAIPRYRTMQGYRVRRQWGWDCHGLPVENLVEKELGFKTKRDIESYGIEKFNKAARVSIMKDVSDWKRIIPRLGRWADMERDYKTMDASYTESVWWAFKNLYDKGLVYEGFKSMHLCPRCGTTLSNFEVAQGYKDIDDVSVTVKLRLVDEPDTSLLVWTTTPWTLPGNAAAAVNASATYVKAKTPEGFVILAKDRVEAVLGRGEELKEEIEGKKLVGKKYLPPFDYFANELHKHKTHAWKVYAAPFVTMDSGTGIVHIAPAFGADDLELSQKEKIPVIHHVTEEGKFISTVRDFEHLSVKPKGNPRETDEKIAAHLKEKGLLFAQEKISHSYPHCWRCDTPLLNWAANSWFVKVSALKSKLLGQNAQVGWTPEHVGEGRFNNGLQSAPDWAISRSRYWGAPLPVWRNQKTKEVKVAGSVDDLLSMVRRSGNRYFVMRHGEAHSNVSEVLDSDRDPENHLTEAGRARVKETGELLRKQQIDLIIASPFLRTKETAEIVRREIGLPESAVMVDERLRETGLGVYSGRPIKEWQKSFTSMADRFAKGPEGGESFAEVRRRMGEFLFEIERRYTNKNILIVSHGNPLWLINKIASRTDSKELEREVLPLRGEAAELPFTPFPHNEDYELDLHRPYIDEIPMGGALTGEWKRVDGVFDCWFESGSMPFASTHYPFNKETFDPKRFFGWGSRGYPADFIAEGLDQTRGWFYSLIVLGTALFGRAPYRNVIVNGLILASDGQKMSKRLKNYPDPMEVVDKYGADALRYYLLSSPVVRAEDLRFQERGVEEVQKKLLMRLDNVRSFYDLYAHGTPSSSESAHPLDRWIVSRLGELLRDTTVGFEAYALDIATRPLMGFVDDLSTWYLRRSRDRFKEEGQNKESALATLRFIFHTLSRIMAPVLPFYADDLYRRVRAEGEPESVHLTQWPSQISVDDSLLSGMVLARAVASQGLEARERAGMKVRQPLGKLTAKELPVDEALRAIVAEEVNVKEVAEDTQQHEEVVLDTHLTAELKEEGKLREWVRAVQGWRKEQNLKVEDRPGLLIVGPEAEFIRAHREAIMEATGLLSLEAKEGEEVELKRL